MGDDNELNEDGLEEEELDENGLPKEIDEEEESDDLGM